MIITTRKKELYEIIGRYSKEHIIGFVPTMGALHEGHLSLIRASREKCSFTVCSIFVNPTQFNDSSDLEKYPRPVSSDIIKLTQAGCDLLFLPTYDEIYEDPRLFDIDLGGLDQVAEGKMRENHFKGVINVCKRLFDIVQPNQVFFGQKDYQQCLVIRKMIRFFNLPIQFNMIPIQREQDGLAMSSRNIRLSEQERKTAAFIPQILMGVQNLVHKYPGELENFIHAEFSKHKDIILEYAYVADATDLKPATDKNWPAVILVACRIGNTRLIDNLIIYEKN